MLDQRFESPTSIQTACSLLSQAEGRIAILAGGTDLMPRFNKRMPALRPNLLLCLGKLNLNYIRQEGQTLIMGACTTHAAISSSETVNKYAPLLGKACSDIGSPAIRNAGTIGGNVCNAAPWADGIAALLALDASVAIASTSGERVMKLEDFVKAPSITEIRCGEILKEIHIPVISARHKSGWFKQGQRKGTSISVVSVAVCMEVHEGICRDVRISIGAVARMPYVSKAASAILEGQHLSEQLAEKAGATVSEEVNAREDSRASAWYRKKVVGTLVKRVISGLI